MKRVLDDPDEFFARQSTNPSLLAPVAVVLFAGIAVNLNTVLVLPAFSQTLSGQSKTIAQVLTLIGAAGGSVGIFVLWFVYAGSFYTISVYFDGDGRFRTIFLLTGWGFLPLMVHGLFSSAVFSYTLQQATVPQDPEQLKPFVQSLKYRPPIVASSIIRFLFLGWQALLWTFAVSHSRELSIREAAVTVGIPTFITVVVNVYDLVDLLLGP